MSETEEKRRWAPFAVAGVFLAVVAVGVASFVSTGRIDSLLRELAHGNAEKVAAAGEALGACRAPYAVRRILVAGAAAPERSQMAARMPEVVAAIGDAAVEPLAGLIEKGTSRERGWALRRLGDIGGARALELLGAALDDKTAYHDETTYIRAGAVTGLVRIGTEEAHAMLVGACEGGMSHWLLFYGSIRNAAEEFGDNRVYAVAFRSNVPLVRKCAAMGLGELEVALGRTGADVDPLAVGCLVAALSDGDAEVRAAAATALGGLCSAEAVEPLVALLSDGDEEVRFAAAIALAAIGTDEAVTAVDVFCADMDIDLAEVAANHRDYIAGGKLDTELFLLLALERHGDDEMAVRVYRCRNGRLSSGAIWWSRRHDGIEIFDNVTIEDFVIWGADWKQDGATE